MCICRHVCVCVCVCVFVCACLYMCVCVCVGVFDYARCLVQRSAGMFSCTSFTPLNRVLQSAVSIAVSLPFRAWFIQSEINC